MCYMRMDAGAARSNSSMVSNVTWFIKSRNERQWLAPSATVTNLLHRFCLVSSRNARSLPTIDTLGEKARCMKRPNNGCEGD